MRIPFVDALAASVKQWHQHSVVLSGDLSTEDIGGWEPKNFRYGVLAALQPCYSMSQLAA